MDNIKNVKKIWINSLGFLENHYLNSSIVTILLLYCSTIFNNINMYIGNLYNFSIVKILVLFLIVYIAPKDTTIAILLALTYVISLNYSLLSENFEEKVVKHTKESFQPFFPLENTEYKKQDVNEQEKTDNSCLKNYVPTHEVIGDACEPVSTFKDELNAQGLNSPEGFDNTVIGSPIM